MANNSIIPRCASITSLAGFGRDENGLLCKLEAGSIELDLKTREKVREFFFEYNRYRCKVNYAIL